MKRNLLFCAFFCTVFFACSKEEEAVKPDDTAEPAPIATVPDKEIAEVETVSATVNSDGSITLTGKVNKIDPTVLDYGFTATLDSLYGPPWNIIEMKSKPALGAYSKDITASDTRFKKGKKYYFSAVAKYPVANYKRFNIMSFVVPE